MYKSPVSARRPSVSTGTKLWHRLHQLMLHCCTISSFTNLVPSQHLLPLLDGAETEVERNVAHVTQIHYTNQGSSPMHSKSKQCQSKGLLSAPRCGGTVAPWAQPEAHELHLRRLHTYLTSSLACHLNRLALGRPLYSTHRDSPRCQAKLLLHLPDLPWPMSCILVHSLAPGRPLAASHDRPTVSGVSSRSTSRRARVAVSVEAADTSVAQDISHLHTTRTHQVRVEHAWQPC